METTRGRTRLRSCQSTVEWAFASLKNIFHIFEIKLAHSWLTIAQVNDW